MIKQGQKFAFMDALQVIKETPDDPAISSSSKVNSSVAELEFFSGMATIFDASAILFVISPYFSKTCCFFLLCLH